MCVCEREGCECVFVRERDVSVCVCVRERGVSVREGVTRYPLKLQKIG